VSGSVKRRPDGKWRARYRDASGKEFAKHFPRRVDGQRWLDEQTSALVTGMHVDPKTARSTVEEWCDTWLDGYGTRRASSVRQARTHIAHIVAEFGPRPIGTVRPSDVKAWTAKLYEKGLDDSYVYAIYRRLSQIMSDAVLDGVIPRNPCSRRTSPPQGKQRPYVATTKQVWELHDAMPAHLRPAVLLGAFTGLRTAETCGLRVADVDFMRDPKVNPAVQYPAEPLKTEMSRTPIPIPRDLANTLSAHVAAHRAEHLVSGEDGEQLGPWVLQRAVAAARGTVDGLPEGFRYHDLRHYYASLLIASGANVKVVQSRLRHASAKTTLDTYGHLWPDQDEATRTAVETVLVARADYLRTGTMVN